MLLHFKVIRELSENYREDTLQPVTKKSNRFHVLHTVALTFTHQSQFEYVMSMSLYFCITFFCRHFCLLLLLLLTDAKTFLLEKSNPSQTHTHTHLL